MKKVLKGEVFILFKKLIDQFKNTIRWRHLVVYFEKFQSKPLRNIVW